MFSAQTTIFPAKSGRSFTAVARHEINFSPSSRTAVEMKAVRNSLAAPPALLDARTVIGGTIRSAGGDEICSALTTRRNSTPKVGSRTRRREFSITKNIGRLAALDSLLGSREPNKQIPSRLRPEPTIRAADGRAVLLRDRPAHAPTEGSRSYQFGPEGHQPLAQGHDQMAIRKHTPLRRR